MADDDERDHERTDRPDQLDERDDLDRMFHALADSTRRAILDELATRDEQPLFELCVRLLQRHGKSFSRQAVSKHLMVLESAGLVAVRWAGRTKLHSSTLPDHLSRLTEWLQGHAREGDDR